MAYKNMQEFLICHLFFNPAKQNILKSPGIYYRNMFLSVPLVLIISV